jgi:hypothetical protein
MSWRVLAILLPLACSAAGCWSEACTYGHPASEAACADRWTGLYGLGDEDALDWCAGRYHPFASCDGLGYSVECDGWYYQPGSGALLECQAYR